MALTREEREAYERKIHGRSSMADKGHETAVRVSEHYMDEFKEAYQKGSGLGMLEAGSKLAAVTVARALTGGTVEQAVEVRTLADLFKQHVKKTKDAFDFEKSSPQGKKEGAEMEGLNPPSNSGGQQAELRAITTPTPGRP